MKDLCKSFVFADTPLVKLNNPLVTETIQVSEGNEYIRKPHVGQPCSK